MLAACSVTASCVGYTDGAAGPDRCFQACLTLGCCCCLRAQIRRLCLTLEDPCPEGEAYEAFMTHPEHVLARLARDIGKPDVVEKSLDHPMQVPTVPRFSCTVPLPSTPRPGPESIAWGLRRLCAPFRARAPCAACASPAADTCP